MEVIINDLRSLNAIRNDAWNKTLWRKIISRGGYANLGNNLQGHLDILAKLTITALTGLQIEMVMMMMLVRYNNSVAHLIENKVHEWC